MPSPQSSASGTHSKCAFTPWTADTQGALPRCQAFFTPPSFYPRQSYYCPSRGTVTLPGHSAARRRVRPGCLMLEPMCMTPTRCPLLHDSSRRLWGLAQAIQASPHRRKEHCNCHSIDEVMGTERDSGLSQVPQTSRTPLAMLYLKESPLHV